MSSWNLHFGRERPLVQVILWTGWKGLRWHRWRGSYDRFFRGSLLLGRVELRFWR